MMINIFERLGLGLNASAEELAERINHGYHPSPTRYRCECGHCIRVAKILQEYGQREREAGKRREREKEIAELRARCEKAEGERDAAKDCISGAVRVVERVERERDKAYADIQAFRELKQKYEGDEIVAEEAIGHIADAFEVYGLVVGHEEEDILVAIRSLGERMEAKEWVCNEQVKLLKSRDGFNHELNKLLEFSISETENERQDHAATRQRLAEAEKLVCFFACTIKCGEPWSETCETEMRSVLDARTAGPDA